MFWSTESKVTMKEISESKEALQGIIIKAKPMLITLLDMKYKKISKKDKGCFKSEILFLLEEYIEQYIFLRRNTQEALHKTEFETRHFEVQLVLIGLLSEMKKIRLIWKRQLFTKDLQVFKQRVYAICNSDLSIEYVAKLEEDAHFFQRKVVDNDSNVRFPDLFQELEELISKISGLRENTKKQVILESVSGVLTLGSSVASGVLGGIAIAGRTAAPAVKGTTDVVSKTAAAAVRTSKLTNAATSVMDLSMSASDAVVKSAPKVIDKLDLVSKTAAAAVRNAKLTKSVSDAVVKVAPTAIEKLELATKVSTAVANTGKGVFDVAKAFEGFSQNDQNREQAKLSSDKACDMFEVLEDLITNVSFDNNKYATSMQDLAKKFYKRVVDFEIVLQLEKYKK